MLDIFKKRIDRQALVAVCPSDEAVSIARVRRARDLPPSLELCHVEHTDSVSVQGAQIARLAKSMHLDGFLCVTTLGLGDYLLSFVEAPDVPPAELRAALRWRVKDLIDFHIDDAVIDVFEVPDQKTPGRNAMMYAVVTKAGFVKQRIDLLTGAGMNLDVIDIPELALRNLAALLPEDVAGVALIYLDRQRGLITLSRQGTLYLSRRLDVGWHQMGDDLESAEPMMDRIVVEIQRSLDYYESHFLQPPITSVAVTPLPAALAGVDAYLADQLGISVRSIDINSLIDVAEPVPPDLQPLCLMAVGAALRQEGKQL